MADHDYTRLVDGERCTAEIPANSSADCQDATVCGAMADLLCEEGPRCRECFVEFGGTPVTADPQYYRPEPRPQLRPFDFGTAMLCALDRLEKEGVL